jgi:hypothetical protein
MRTFALVLFTAFLAACQTTQPQVEYVAEELMSSSSSSVSESSASLSDRLTVRLEKTVVQDDDATVRTRAFLHLSGALNETINLGDEILGELQYVDPKSYGRFAYDNADTVAVLTTWWAGQGEEIYITQFHDPHAFTVEHRYGDEGGICSPPGLIVDLPLQGDVQITLEGFGEPTVERSSIDFPCTAP